MLTARQLRDDFRYLFRDEVGALEQLAVSLPPNPVVVNIGAGAGTSGLLFLQSRPDLVLHTIDIENRDSPLGSLYSERAVMEQAGLADQAGVRWHQWHANSQQLCYQWGIECHLLFIDGDHSYEGCKNDICGWGPLVKPDGIIAVHDYKKDAIAPTEDGPHPRAWPGVDRAVDEFLLPYYDLLLQIDSLIAFRIPEWRFR